MCFTGVDSFIPVPKSRYLSGRVVREGAFSKEVGVLSEQVLARAAGAAGAKDAEQCPS